jgi:hypothetical protein
MGVAREVLEHFGCRRPAATVEDVHDLAFASGQAGVGAVGHVSFVTEVLV